MIGYCIGANCDNMKSIVIETQIYQILNNINMKHITSILYKNKYFLYCLFLTSCNPPEPIENHKGGIIYKKENPTIYMRFKVKYKDKDSKYNFKTVYVLEFDWNKYQVGDTIK